MIEFGHLTRPGLRRELNEDTYHGDGELALWLVADGIGGPGCGEVASALARETIVREVRRGAALVHAIRTADEEIIRTSRRRKDTLPMGTTVVAARVQGNRYEVAWVGDSSAYL
ncbi:MAG: Protein phosphatase PrpC [Stenotrophomonas maltophilia]|uniref:Protein phosphatase PrpC n=1 Tax=Stenotrophomonas maltophilia TaxID=40324 RepID=A0A7V8FE95_STEMA|nr:MAG: Protein phosphatase PrpC [Stenotrophomonas maltophilia]